MAYRIINYFRAAVFHVLPLWAFILLLSALFAPEAGAQTFSFYDGSGSAVTSGFTFVKIVRGVAKYPAASPGGRFIFTRPLSFEYPDSGNYQFVSARYDVDTSRTPAETLGVLNGQKSAPAASGYAVYLKPAPGVSSRSRSNYSKMTDGAVPAQKPAKAEPARTTTAGLTKNDLLSLKLGTGKGVQNGNRPATPQAQPQPAVAQTTKANTVSQATTGTGSINGFIGTTGNPLPPEKVVVTVTSRNNTVVKTTTVDTTGYQSTYPFEITGVPSIIPGSGDSYKVNVVSNNSYTANPYSQTSNIRIYGNGQTVYLNPITMSLNRGTLNVTLYHGQAGIAESESYLSVLAQNAVINIPGFATSFRYVGESPARFYRYAISDAPAGQWTVQVMFPGHRIAGSGVNGGYEASVWIPSNSTITSFFNLTE